MTTYALKREQIQAIRYTEGNDLDVASFINKTGNAEACIPIAPGWVGIITEGYQIEKAIPGDWVVQRNGGRVTVWSGEKIAADYVPVAEVAE